MTMSDFWEQVIVSWSLPSGRSRRRFLMVFMFLYDGLETGGEEWELWNWKLNADEYRRRSDSFNVRDFIYWYDYTIGPFLTNKIWLLLNSQIIRRGYENLNTSNQIWLEIMKSRNYFDSCQNLRKIYESYDK